MTRPHAIDEIPIRQGSGGLFSDPILCSDLHDETGKQNKMLDGLLKLRQRLNRRVCRQRALRFWESRKLLDYDELHARATKIVEERKPAAVGRLGAVEANIVFWARRIPAAFPLNLMRPLFRETRTGATNAGVRPRNRDSYLLFGNLAYHAMTRLDLCGVWKTDYEAHILTALPTVPVFNGETFAPSINGAHHWMRSLNGKRVLVVSPFEATIKHQIPKLADVWSGAGWKPEIDFQVVRFPYLIDDGFPEPWWEVHNRIGSVVAAGDYDVALFGCGGLGLPFAAMAKEAGRVGIQLGGQLQLLFGIYGRRHLDQDWHRVSMNSHWVSPDADEVPQSAKRVENGCYW
jgi:hypothetical protein